MKLHVKALLASIFTISILQFALHFQNQINAKIHQTSIESEQIAMLQARALIDAKMQNLTNFQSENNPTRLNLTSGESIPYWAARNFNNSEEIRLLCVLMITNQSDSIEAAILINSTWGAYCDILIFASNDMLPERFREQWLEIKKYPEESSFNLFPKAHQIWGLVYERYRDKADWFLKADDDSFVVVPNLKQYLWKHFSFNTSVQTTPRFVGRRFKEQGDPNLNFNQGGASYVVNRAGLEKLGKAFIENTGYCTYRNGAEDVGVAGCLKWLGVLPEDTRDELGRERFNSHSLESLFNPDIHDAHRDWYDDLSYNLEKFEGCCSREIISFHWLKPFDLRKYFYAFYRVQ
jgi:glycoprotein-N-acetylgalactosamine 3-beta-galactosyltransferase